MDEGFFKADAVNEETPSATALPHEEEEEEAEEEEGNSLFIANAVKEEDPERERPTLV